MDIKLTQLTRSQKELAAQIGAGIVFAVIGYVLTVNPVMKEVGRLKQSALEAKERNELSAQVRQLAIELKKLEAVVQEEGDRAQLLGNLSSWANDSGFEVQKLTPLSSPVEDNGGEYSKLIFELNAWAHFGSLKRFLDTLESQAPYIAVAAMDISMPSRRGRGTEAQALPVIKLVLKTHLKQG